MSASHRTSTFPTARPTSSAYSNRCSSTVEATSERGSIGSDEPQEITLADEAQTCYNILLILRNDTQHLISLRNENLAALENQSGLDEDAASSKTALLACINESITAATRSIVQLGPFLDRHRWPTVSRPTTPVPQRRSFTISFKPRRRRSKSTSGLATGTGMAENSGSPFSADELFSWTLALTAQHTAVLVATERLCTFLESGIANVSEEERKRRDARASWWQQSRGGFENVGLIQSLLGRPKRTSAEVSQKEKAAVATNSTLEDVQVINGENTENLTPIMDTDDNRSETLTAAVFTPATSISTLTQKGLTARPRHQLMDFHQQQQEVGFSVRRICTDPVVSPSPETPSSSYGSRLARMETFGAGRPSSQLSPFGSSKPSSRIATSLLPAAITLQNKLSEQPGTTLTQDYDDSVALSAFSEGDHLSAGKLRKYAEPTPPFIPSASPEKQIASKTALSSQKEKIFSMSSSPGAEMVNTPYTPLDIHNTGLFTHHALTLPTSGISQPPNRGLENMIISSEQGAKNVAIYVSPVETKSRVSTAPLIEGPDNMIVSPVDTEPGTVAQPLLGISPITSTGTNERASPDDADGHMAWLVYMERKRQVCASRWSLRRANTNDV